MNLSEVPLQVLEKVRNKWEKILDFDDPDRGDVCAMCEYVDDEIGGLCRRCPIRSECDEIGDGSPGWNERRERFLLSIRAEIERRAEAA